MSRPIRPWPAPEVELPSPVAPATNTRSGTSGCSLCEKLFGNDLEGVQARVAEAGDLAQQDCRLGQNRFAGCAAIHRGRPEHGPGFRVA